MPISISTVGSTWSMLLGSDPDTLLILGVAQLIGILCILVVISVMLHRLRTGPRPIRRTPPRRKQRQSLYVNPVPHYASALVKAVIDEMDSIYRSQRNEVWDRIKDPEVPGIIFRPYNPEQEEAGLANLETSEIGIQWHRFQGNFESCDQDWSPIEWVTWFERTIAAIRNTRFS